MLRDLRFALRQLLKSPGFALTAVLTLALGIGANVAIFTLVDSILLRPLPFPQQDRLARVGYSNDDASFFPKGWIRALQQNSVSFSAISGFGPNVESNVSFADSSDRVFGTEVLPNTFDTLMIRPEIGSFFTQDDLTSGRDAVLVLSYSYWQQHFGKNPNVIGQTLRIDGISRRIIGVMPSGVRFPYADTQFVTPVTFKGGDPIDPWVDFDLNAFGRLKDGVTPAQAQAELRRLQAVLLPLFPWRMPDIWASEMTAVPLLESQTGGMRPRLALLFGAVGLILFIACANVANLMLARAAGREREMAIRAALGASTHRLIRQLLSESVVVGVLAGIAGLLAAASALRGVVPLLPADTPRLREISLGGPTLLFAAAASVFAGLLFGLVPALKMASPSLQEALRSGGRSIAGKASQFRLSMLLVIGQIGLSVVVITIAGLMLRSLYALSQVDPGFQTDRVVTAEVSLDATACQQKGRCNSFFTTLLNRAQGLAGLESLALTDSVPLSGRVRKYVFDAEDHPRDARQGALLANQRIVSPGYFASLGLRLLRGRLLTDEDASGTSRAVVINERMAERLWPNQNPLGKYIIDVGDEPSPAVWDMKAASVVVGVVANAHSDTLAGGYGDELFLPMTAKREHPVMYVLLRLHANVPATAASLREVVGGIDPLVPVTRVHSLNELMSLSVAGPRSLTILLLAFGALALVIGGVGAYSLISYIVSWRRREIGIRLAIGAMRWQIISGVMKQSLTLAAVGSLVGLIASALLAHWLRSFMFGVSSLDPLTFCTVPTLMLMLALLAAWIPARRAARIDPMETLRGE